MTTGDEAVGELTWLARQTGEIGEQYRGVTDGGGASGLMSAGSVWVWSPE
ncbi:hypothetical protein ACFTWF_24570 [Rhodococcus sp. NPDC056960]